MKGMTIVTYYFHFKFVAFNKLEDAGAVASAAAARIYGLNILARDIQVCLDFL